jgi:hypothetical protein
MSKIQVVNGAKYVWQMFPGLRNRGITTYCADGDGFIEVRVLNKTVGLYDQGQRVRTFDAVDLTDALRKAEIYADAVYPTMLDAYRIEPWDYSECERG